MPTIVAVPEIEEALRPTSDWDAVVLVASAPSEVPLAALRAPLASAARLDAKLGETISLLPAEVAGGRLVVAPTGPLGREHDDVRRFAEAARDGVRRARDAGARRPLLVVTGVPEHADFAAAVPVAALGALGGLWEPLEAREAQGASVVEPVAVVGLGTIGRPAPGAALADWVGAVEHGRRVARDLCGTEPERMAPAGFVAYCREALAAPAVEIEVLDDVATIGREYPLLGAVARASLGVPRHRPRVVRLGYTGEGPIERSYLLAGKGLTFDSGGADLKTGGGMAGMSRDKGGAAAVAGLFAAAARLRPRGVVLRAELGVLRNSIGADCLVPDEIVTGHAGVRVRIGNTDAEGRLVLADLLSHLRVLAHAAVAPQLFSVATLTGHAGRAVGPYSIAIDNGPARAAAVAPRLAEIGERWGDPFEISRLRREDWDFVKPRSKADDVLSCNNAPSSATSRGHQFPMALLAIASGLAAHCHRDAARPLPFTHIDIGGSAVEGTDWQNSRPTAAPVTALVAALLGTPD